MLPYAGMLRATVSATARGYEMLRCVGPKTGGFPARKLTLAWTMASLDPSNEFINKKLLREVSWESNLAAFASVDAGSAPIFGGDALRLWRVIFGPDTGLRWLVGPGQNAVGTASSERGPLLPGISHRPDKTAPPRFHVEENDVFVCLCRRAMGECVGGHTWRTRGVVVVDATRMR